MPGIGSRIDEIWTLREAKRDLESEVKAIEKDINALSEQLLETMAINGLFKSTGARATVSISELVKPSVEDWDVFYAYIRKTNQFHLMERRPSVVGCRELFDLKGAIPGVVPFTHRRLNVRTVKK